MNATVTELANQLIVSYAKVGGINHLDGKNLPSKSVIAGITLDLLRLLFPGFFDERMIHSSELKVEMVSLVDSVAERLEDELYKSLEYATPEGLARKDLRPMAHETTICLLRCLPRIREVLKTDVDAAFNGDPAALSQEEIIVAYPFVETIARCEIDGRLGKPARQEAASDDRGSGHDLSGGDHSRGRDGDRRGQHHRRKCVPHHQCPGQFAGRLRGRDDEGDEQTRTRGRGRGFPDLSFPPLGTIRSGIDLRDTGGHLRNLPLWRGVHRWLAERELSAVDPRRGRAIGASRVPNGLARRGAERP